MNVQFSGATGITFVLITLLLSSPAPAQQQLQNDPNLWPGDGGQKRIDLDIFNMEIESVLKIISDTSGWTIIPSPKVQGKISLWSKGSTAAELLEKLSLVNDYVYRQEGNLIYLMTKDEYDQLFGRATKTFFLNHQKAENIKPLLENSLTKTGRLAVDPWSNTIVASDTTENLNRIESLIARLDQGFVQKRFVLVNAKAAEVVRILDKLCPKEGPFEADVRTNSVIISNSESNVERIAKLIAQLDQDSVTKVFQIKFQPASELASQITALLGGSGGETPEPKEQVAAKQLIVSEATNQIIVTGSASVVCYVEDIIEKLDSRVISTAIVLKNLKASQILPQVSGLASRPENITADSQGNRLIIRDNERNVEQIRKIVQELDQSMITRVFTLDYATAEDIQSALQSFVADPQLLRIEPRTNQIILSASESQVARIKSIIESLDREDAYFTRTYHLEYASASYVADIIETFISRQGARKIFLNAGPETQVESVESFTEPTAKGPSEPVSVSTEPGPGNSTGPQPPSPPPSDKPTLPSPPPVQVKPAEVHKTERPVTESIGAAGTVVADDRGNTVTVTETLGTLAKIEQLINEIDVPTCSYTYTMKYRRLDSVGLDAKLPPLLRPQQDCFSTDNQTNTIYFNTIPSVAEKVLKMLEQWDKPAKQALIRAKILAVNTSTLKDIGVDFELLFGFSDADVSLESSLPSQVGADHAGALTVRKLTGTQFQAIIRAIESDNSSRILANPRILVMEGQSAEVRMATDEPFTETSIDAQNGRTIENIRFLQVGTILQVKPTIKEDNTIEMYITLDVSSLVEIRNGVPVVNRNVASSTVAVEDNQVLMIGGLKFTRDINVNEKVPVLADLPLIGGLFNSRRNELADTELVLLLQPTIVGTPKTPRTDFAS
jgi:type II secretory pathway component GspD/PulD (secretin)